jgi:enoyl-CoA hydratase/carnithine racemase
LPLFHVAVINGVALGWGTEYVLTADYRIACAQSVYALPETGLGILPGAGGTAELWAQVGLPQALRLGMTGERIDANEACRIGLVQEVLPDVDAGLARAKALAERVSRNSPTAVAAFKRAALAAVGANDTARVEIETKAYEHCLDSGEAAIGRTHFANIRAGEPVPWGPLEIFE